MSILTFGSLFAGIGGMDLGLERAGMVCRWQVEINPYAQRVLAKHWPDITRYGDICAVDWSGVERIDVLAGGFPCQDISLAGGPGTGLAGDRSGLWREFARAICELRPNYVLVENVPALLHRGIDRVLGDLAALGYDAEWDVLAAAHVGAPHLRERLFVVAHAIGKQYRGRVASNGATPYQREQSTRASTGLCAPTRQWANEPNVGRMAYGVPHRVERLRGLGNAVVPQVAELIGAAIVRHAAAQHCEVAR